VIQQLFDLSGKTALVTGSSRGIGRAIALALAEHGAGVAIHGVSNLSSAEETAREVEQLGVRAAAFQADLAERKAILRLHSEVVAKLGHPDILVLNASLQIRSPWQAIDVDDAQRQIATNFLSSLELIRLCQPAMAERKWGRVLTVGSVQQVKPHRDMAIYAATKAAQLNLVRNLAAQLAPDGITINNLAPGVILTDRNTGPLADKKYAKLVRAKIPVGYFGEAEDCIGAALLLCSDAGRYITGADLLIDGGMSL
jgi:NAD(P)-dependent dehydrogenase (short-subunit alcohol dehydrogenase family)